MFKGYLKIVPAILILFFCSSFVLAQSQEISLPKIEKNVLDNGLTLLTIERHDLPVVSFRLVLKSGSAYDPNDKPGLADLTAGLLRKGTKTKSAIQISEAVDFIGGELGAGADWDVTYATCRVLSKYFDTGLDLLSDIVLNPVFSEDEIQRLAQQTIAGIKQSKDNPSYLADINFRKFLFEDYPYGRPREGTETSIASIKRDDIVKFYERYYCPNNVILAVVGDIKPKEVLQKVKAKFGNWKKKEIPLTTFSLPPAPKGIEILLVDKPDLTQAYVKIGNFGIERSSPDYFPCRIANYILGGGSFSSRLMEIVRVQRGLTYDVNSYFEVNKLKGAFLVSTFTRNDSTEAAIRAILREMRRIREEKVTEKELADTKSFYSGFFALQLETPDQVATQIVNIELYNLGADYIKNYRKYVNSVTEAQVLEVAKKYFDPDNIKICVIGPAQVLKPMLEKIGKVEEKSFLE
jgi:zinc protease